MMAAPIAVMLPCGNRQADLRRPYHLTSSNAQYTTTDHRNTAGLHCPHNPGVGAGVPAQNDPVNPI